jgi:hypothetical protein
MSLETKNRSVREIPEASSSITRSSGFGFWEWVRGAGRQHSQTDRNNNEKGRDRENVRLLYPREWKCIKTTSPLIGQQTVRLSPSSLIGRSGKSSIQRVVFHKMQPNETLFLESTTKITKDNIKYF